MTILLHVDLNDEQVEALRQLARNYGDHQVLQTTDEEEAIRMAPDVEVVMGRCPPSVFAAAPRLRWYQCDAAGVDKFLFPELVESDVVMTNMAGIYAPQGAEQAWALLLALSRGLFPPIQDWNPPERWDKVVELTGSTLGIIGMGGFGLEMVKRAAGYDLTILALDPKRTVKPDGVAELKPPTQESLHDLLHRSDAVIVTCPLTQETHHLIGRAELRAMKTGAFLVNVSRGGIIDEEALVEALEQGQILGAGLDTVEQEPLPPESPLWNAPRLILTPHLAGSSQHRPRKVFEFFLQNLERYVKGDQLLNVVDKRRGF